MKKLILAILFTLVLSEGSYAETLNYECKIPGVKKLEYINYTLDTNRNKLIGESLWDGKYERFEFNILEIDSERVRVSNKDYNPWYFYYATDQRGFMPDKNQTHYYECDFDFNKVNQLSKNISNNSYGSSQSSGQNISFNIKQKKEQCEAIGFKPETEKFADCVLRLVELDVKQQTQNQIVSAQNSGNDALVKQLERQNNLQSSQALINLGQQLMNPKQYNSNIYMPQTRRCTVSGFGVTSVVRCY
jgi:hypothetical protein